MNIPAHPLKKTGSLRIHEGIHSDEKALAIKAALEDLPGVYAAEFTPDAVNLRFDPELASEQQFYKAVKLAGFRASNFAVLRNN